MPGVVVFLVVWCHCLIVVIVSGVLRCVTLSCVRVQVSTRWDEELLGVVRARAVVERRTLTGMLERLVVLGLGRVVEERAAAVVDSGTVVQTVAGETAVPGRGEVSRPARSSTACSNAHFHRAGVFCKTCGRTP